MARKTGIQLIRQKVRERDNNTCQICGKKWEHGNRRFDVHHLDLKMEGNIVKAYFYDKDNMDKLMTLCHRCHLTMPHNKKKRQEGIYKSWRAKGLDIQKRYKAIVYLRMKNYTFQQIGDILKISRQRAHFLFRKRA